jgi:anti-sigma factor RsiW
MKTLSCAATRRRLSAFYDGELSLRQQIVVEGHLRQCPACSAEAALMGELGDALRAGNSASEYHGVDLGALQATVLPRIKAERTTSLMRQVETLFDDMHLVWAAACGMAAVVVCGVLLFGLLRMLHVTTAQPHSLAALVETLSRSPVPPLTAEPLVLPRAYPEAVMPATVMNQQTAEDAVFALAATVTREGNLSDIEVLQPAVRAGEPTAQETRLVYNVVDAASTARFEPARKAGAPVSVNVVWVLTHTTVRGKARTFRTKAPQPSPELRPVGAAAPEPVPAARLLTSDDGEFPNLAMVAQTFRSASLSPVWRA